MHEATMCTYGNIPFLCYVQTYDYIFSKAFADRLHLKCALLFCALTSDRWNSRGSFSEMKSAAQTDLLFERIWRPLEIT